MSKPVQYIYRLILVLSMLWQLSACDMHDDPVSNDPESAKSKSVSFSAHFAPDDFGSRAGEGKTDFADGDVIHIAAHFYEGNIDQDTEGNPVGEAQYCAYSYLKGEWISIMDNHEIKWPYSCDYGVFTAYYISHANGAINTIDEATSDWLLGEFKEGGLSDDTGPMSTGTVRFPFGHVVSLKFSHMCARLSITNLDTSTIGEYWLSKPGDTEFHNAYRLVRDREKGIKFEWRSVESEEYGTYIARSLDKNVPSEYGNAVTIYLEPDAMYSGCKLNYRYNRGYITLNSNKLNNLKSNCSYQLNITQDTGIVFDDPDDGGWTDPDNPDNAFKLENIPEFLKAAASGQEYSEKGTLILERSATGVILLTDVDFGKRDPLSPTDFPETYLKRLENLSTTVTFDGNFKYIHNSVRPIFNEIQGRLYNLGISNTVRVGKIDSSVSGYGGLSRTVTASGMISNIRINNLSLTLELPYTDNSDSFFIGSIAGLNSGSVSAVSLRGDIKINILDEDKTRGTKSEVLTGGIIGQNAGILSDCTTFTQGADDTVETCITINNSCHNTLAMSTGGIVGYCYNNVENITLNVNIDASQSTASYNFTGGMAGRLRRSDGTNERKYFKGISVDGRVKGGQSVTTEIKTGKSFTGGIAGRLYNFFIDNCNSLCKVEGWNGEIGTNIRYATGGAFGCIATSDVEELVHNTTWWGSAISGLPTNGECYIGTFAGIIPTHRSEEGYKKNGNRANESPSINFFGGQLDDNSTDNGI